MKASIGEAEFEVMAKQTGLPLSAAQKAMLYEVYGMLEDMIARCRKLNLRAVGPERKLVIEFTILLTAKTMHALFGPSRRKWIAL